MTKKLFLSNSQVNTYTDCPRKWHLDKVQRIRPNWTTSALIFGSALDETVEHILLKKEGEPSDVFLNAMSNYAVNGKPVTFPKDLLSVRFAASDVQFTEGKKGVVEEILTDEDKINVRLYSEQELEIEPPDIAEFLAYCKQQRKAKTALDKTEQKLLNFISWTSLKRKGLMILPVLQEWFDENVAEVHSVQKKISIQNENGDTFIGFLDFVVTLKDGRKVLIDLKTSANENTYYPADSADRSRQLGIYSQEEQLPDVAYLVASKNIRKREPRVRLKFVEGKITEEHLDNVFDEIEQVITEIKDNLEKGADAFPKNKESCNNYGGCEYRGLCERGDMKGLCYVE